MVDDEIERVFWLWTLLELAVFSVVFLLLASSTFGGGSFLTTVSHQMRLIAMGVVAIQLLIPLFIYFDIRRRPSGSDTIWIHVAAMPVLNIFGLIAYLENRSRKQNE